MNVARGRNHMLEKIILPVITGITGSLIAYLITSLLEGMTRELRWLVVVAIGLVMAVAAAMLSRLRASKSDSPSTRVASGIKGDDIKLGKINVKDGVAGSTDVLSDIKGGRVESGDVNVERRKG
jgi:hypothetical protein